MTMRKSMLVLGAAVAAGFGLAGHAAGQQGQGSGGQGAERGPGLGEVRPAQPGGAAPQQGRRPVRRSVIDLEAAALAPRPGQILLGSGPEEGAAPARQPVPADSEQAARAASAAAANRPELFAGVERPGHLDVGPTEPLALRAFADGERGVAEVRADGGEWGRLVGGVEVVGRDLGVRTGIDGAAEFVLDETVRVVLGRLTSVRIVRDTDPRTPEEHTLVLERGVIQLVPLRRDAADLAVSGVRIITPDASSVERSAVEIRHDAFDGTRRTGLGRR